jgi:hypothetical protein
MWFFAQTLAFTAAFFLIGLVIGNARRPEGKSKSFPRSRPIKRSPSLPHKTSLPYLCPGLTRRGFSF